VRPVRPTAALRYQHFSRRPNDSLTKQSHDADAAAAVDDDDYDSVLIGVIAHTAPTRPTNSWPPPAPPISKKHQANAARLSDTGL